MASFQCLNFLLPEYLSAKFQMCLLSKFSVKRVVRNSKLTDYTNLMSYGKVSRQNSPE
jgi:hypothetical protein